MPPRPQLGAGVLARGGLEWRFNHPDAWLRSVPVFSFYLCHPTCAMASAMGDRIGERLARHDGLAGKIHRELLVPAFVRYALTWKSPDPEEAREAFNRELANLLELPFQDGRALGLTLLHRATAAWAERED